MLKWSQVKGGVHPDSHKSRSSALSIIQARLPETLVLPLRQHAGSEAIPLVRPGDKVLKGQQIAVAGSDVSAPVHASTSGKIIAIAECPVPHPSGLPANAIMIESDGDDRWIDLDIPSDPFAEPPMELAERVARAGIVGMGGAIFPAAVKLKQGTRHEIKTVLVNGSECEPYLTTDDRLMRERAEQIVDGARLIQHILRAYRIVIAIEDNKTEAIAAMRAAAEPYGAIEIAVTPTLYPMGSAKQLIQEITGQEVPAGGRSTAVGVLVHNVGTVYAIQQALRFGRPLISRVVTVAGGCVKNPRNVETVIGASVDHLINACGGLKDDPARLLLGGPMMGVALPSAHVPVIKGATGILALRRNEIPLTTESPCIRCARCVQACPMGLLPLEMARHARIDDFDGADAAGLKDCILCGSCAYVCPSHIPLVHHFQYALGEKDARRKVARKNDYTRQLTEARTARLEREAAQKAAAKAAKKNRASTTSEVSP